MESGSEPKLAAHINRMMKGDLLSALSFTDRELTECFAVRKCVATLLLTGSSIGEVVELSNGKLNTHQVMYCVYRMVAADVADLVALSGLLSINHATDPTWTTQQTSTRSLH